MDHTQPGLLYVPYITITHLPNVVVGNDEEPLFTVNDNEVFKATCRANPLVDPVLIRHAMESRFAEDAVRKTYEKEHAACPKCGALDGCTTLMAYVLNMDHPEAYRDRNRFTCAVCDDTHEVHERVPSDTN